MNEYCYLCNQEVKSKSKKLSFFYPLNWLTGSLLVTVEILVIFIILK